jgi:hypothetical protein
VLHSPWHNLFLVKRKVILLTRAPHNDTGSSRPSRALHGANRAPQPEAGAGDGESCLLRRLTDEPNGELRLSLTGGGFHRHRARGEGLAATTSPAAIAAATAAGRTGWRQSNHGRFLAQRLGDETEILVMTAIYNFHVCLYFRFICI